MKFLVLQFFSRNLGDSFESNVDNEYGVMLKGKGPHKPELAYDITLSAYTLS